MKEDKFADEMLDDEELDGVAGGTVSETAEDSQLLYDHGRIDNWRTFTGAQWNWEKTSNMVEVGWAKSRISCITDSSGNNRYFSYGREISREDAIGLLKANFDKVRSH